MKNTRVLIVEDDASLRQSLTDWLSQDYEIHGYESAETFLEDVDDFEFEDGMPTCILLDFQMPGMNGVELQNTLKLMNVECPIIFMSGNALQSDIIDAWHGGAIDFLLKPFTGTQISEALKKIFAKQNQAKPSKASAINEKELIDIAISPREAEVLLMLGQGHRQTEVAQLLGISLRTIKMHRASLKNKLNLNTLVDLTRYCDQHTLSIQKIIDTNNSEA